MKLGQSFRDHADTLRDLDKNGQELLKMMLLKDLRAGVSVSSATVNKVWPGLCLQVPYQRCQTK